MAHSSSELVQTSPPSAVTRALLPFSAVVFLGFLAIGIPLPVLPLQVHDALGYGSFAVGGVIGLQSLATLLTRPYAGRLCEAWGSKRTTLVGLAGAAGAGVLYLASLWPTPAPASLGLLVAGRILLGMGESLFITGTAVWSIACVGPLHAGRAMAWQGMAMYGAMAVGAPAGGILWAAGGFSLVSTVMILMPLLGVLLAASLPAVVVPQAGQPASFLRVLRAIWRQGLGLALASSGFGTIAAFLALQYHAQGWSNPGLALTAFGAAYIAMRLAFGGLPDRLGGRRVATASLLVEAAGLLIIWGAHSAPMALVGTMVTGTGYSLVFPSLGVEAMKRIGPEDRGAALAAYLACFDLGLGSAGPLAGFVAGTFGLPAAFLTAAMAALLSLALSTLVGKPVPERP